ncbi:hypothetical protein, partial [Stieleria sp.]|uniref:hypothetical protein n=1 Tax=Stieleria sp. TaxID=2795976 RepID=UPI0035673EAF
MMSLASSPARRASPEQGHGDATGSLRTAAATPKRPTRWLLRIILLVSFVGILIGGTVVLPGWPLTTVTGPHQTHTISRGDLVVSV